MPYPIPVEGQVARFYPASFLSAAEAQRPSFSVPLQPLTHSHSNQLKLLGVIRQNQQQRIAQLEHQLEQERLKAQLQLEQERLMMVAMESAQQADEAQS